LAGDTRPLWLVSWALIAVYLLVRDLTGSASVGKTMVGLGLANAKGDAAKVSVSARILRNLTIAIPGVQLIEFFVAYQGNNKMQRMGDYLSNTYVVDLRPRESSRGTFAGPMAASVLVTACILALLFVPVTNYWARTFGAPVSANRVYKTVTLDSCEVRYAPPAKERDALSMLEVLKAKGQCGGGTRATFGLALDEKKQPQLMMVVKPESRERKSFRRLFRAGMSEISNSVFGTRSTEAHIWDENGKSIYGVPTYATHPVDSCILLFERSIGKGVRAGLAKFVQSFGCKEKRKFFVLLKDDISYELELMVNLSQKQLTDQFLKSAQASAKILSKLLHQTNHSRIRIVDRNRRSMAIVSPVRIERTKPD
jgi:uncharacterized RDD family membrane protein YckC